MSRHPFSTAGPFNHPRQAGTIENARCSPELSSVHKHIEDDAIYFSRRAREERQAYLRGDCRKCRQVHMELAEAYEFRAHLITRETRRAADELLLAL